VILAEPVGEHILLILEQFRNHQHQRVDIDDKSDDQKVPAKLKNCITRIMAKQDTPRKHHVILFSSKVNFPSHPSVMCNHSFLSAYYRGANSQKLKMVNSYQDV